MTGTVPAISVLMGVYNCEETLDESLNCLLAQTETCWEVIICDDGSADRTAEIVKQWQERFPDKITFLQNGSNRGLSASLNRCLAEASGRFIARMDGDDLCSPERFEKELRYLRDHPHYRIVSTDMQCFDEAGPWGLRSYPSDPVPADLIHGVPFCHAACMMDRKTISDAGGYSEDPAFERVEDYELWVRLYASGIRGGNIHEPLYQMRDDRSAAGRRKWKYRLNEARVRALAVRTLHLPAWNYIYVLRPLILGLLPAGLSSFLHHKKLRRGAK